MDSEIAELLAWLASRQQTFGTLVVRLFQKPGAKQSNWDTIDVCPMDTSFRSQGSDICKSKQVMCRD